MSKPKNVFLSYKDEFESRYKTESKSSVLMTIVILIVSIAYAITGLLCWNGKLDALLYDKRSGHILAIIAWSGAFLMFFLSVYELSRYFLGSNSNKGKVLTILFIPIFPFFFVYRKMARIVKSSKQDIVVSQFSVIMLSSLISLIVCFKIEIQLLSRLTDAFGIAEYITPELVAFVAVSLFTITFFAITNILIYISIVLLEYINSLLIKKYTYSKDVIRVEWSKTKSQLKISKLFYYVVGVLFCSLVHPSSEMSQKMIAAFMSIATIAALTREVSEKTKE